MPIASSCLISDLRSLPAIKTSSNCSTDCLILNTNVISGCYTRLRPALMFSLYFNQISKLSFFNKPLTTICNMAVHPSPRPLSVCLSVPVSVSLLLSVYALICPCLSFSLFLSVSVSVCLALFFLCLSVF